MSRRPDLERFTAECERDPGLLEAFSALGDEPESWLRLAREKGYDLTLDEVRGLVSSYRALTDEELEEVAGGWDGSGDDGGGGTGSGTSGGEGGGGGG